MASTELPVLSEDHAHVTIEPICILVTGFGGFPGVRKNPTARLIHALDRDEAQLARCGVTIKRHILPVVYAAIAPNLRDLAKAFRPDAILHFGVAARRKHFSIETRAMNRLTTLHPDATGATPTNRSIVAGADFVEKASFPAGLIAAALRRAGIDARLSNDAGNYVCNQTFYLSLAARHARSVGFIHTPRFARRAHPGQHRPTLDDARRAAVAALLVMANELRRDRASQLQVDTLAQGADLGSRRDNVTSNMTCLHVCAEPRDESKQDKSKFDSSAARSNEPV